MLIKTRFLFERNEDFGIETTLSTRSLRKTIRLAQARGYFVTVLYFWLNSPELAIERVRARVSTGGHGIPEDVIRRRYYMGLRYFFEDYRDLADRWILADNSETPFKVVAQGWKNSMIIKDNLKYTEIEHLSKMVGIELEQEEEAKRLYNDNPPQQQNQE